MAESLENLGVLYATMGRHSEAVPLYERAYEIGIKLHGQYSPKVTRILSNLADISLRMGEYESAIKLSEKAHSIYVDVHGGKFYAQAINIITLGEAHLGLNRISEAEKFVLQGLDMLSKAQGDRKKFHLAYAYVVLGDVNIAKGETDKAISNFEKGVSNYSELLGPNHPDTLSAAARLEQFAL